MSIGESSIVRSETRIRLIRGLVGWALLVLTTHPAAAASTGVLTVRWDPNTADLDLAGYRVYLSTDAGVFSLPPAQAQPLATTRVVGAGVSETVFTALDSGLVYWVGVTSIDTSANESVFSQIASGQPHDGTVPTVAISNPINGANLSGTIDITATASDDVGV